MSAKIGFRRLRACKTLSARRYSSISNFNSETPARWPVSLRGLVIASLIVVSLTWLVMPVITRLFRPWLYPSDNKR